MRARRTLALIVAAAIVGGAGATAAAVPAIADGPAPALTLSGTVTVDGVVTAPVGATVTATYTGADDAEIDWYTTETPGDVDDAIPVNDEPSDTYVPTIDDAGLYLYAEVYDEDGVPVDSAAVLVPLLSFGTSLTCSVTGTIKVGGSLEVALKGLPDGLTEDDVDLQWNWSNGSEDDVIDIVASDVNKRLSATITVDAVGYSTGTATCAAARTVPTPTFTAATPKITGTAKVGKALKVAPGRWSPRPTFSYQWFASGKKIAKATKSTLSLTKSLVGKKITVKVTGKKAGYVTATKVSVATKKVAKK